VGHADPQPAVSVLLIGFTVTCTELCRITSIVRLMQLGIYGILVVSPAANGFQRLKRRYNLCPCAEIYYKYKQYALKPIFRKLPNQGSCPKTWRASLYYSLNIVLHRCALPHVNHFCQLLVRITRFRHAALYQTSSIAYVVILLIGMFK
jgi:hypothetical protein